MPSTEETTNLKLVGEVEKFPILYNNKLYGYSKRDSVDAAWEKVAKTMKDTAANCKERWRNLRTVFVRKLKPPPSGSSRKNKKPYYLMEAMQFVLPFVKTQNTEETPGNVPSPPELESVMDDAAEELNHEEPEQDYSEQTEDDLAGQTQTQTIVNRPNVADNSEETLDSPAKKKKKQSTLSELDRAFVEFVELKKQKTKPATEDNPRKLFLLSLLPEIQKLTDVQMRSFRRKVLDALDDVLTPMSSSAPTPCGSRPPSAGGILYSPPPQFDQGNSTSQFYHSFTPEQYI